MGTTGSTRSCRSSCGRNGRFGILRLIGHGHGDRLGPICRHGEVETAERAFRVTPWRPISTTSSSAIGSREIAAGRTSSAAASCARPAIPSFVWRTTPGTSSSLRKANAPQEPAQQAQPTRAPARGDLPVRGLRIPRPRSRHGIPPSSGPFPHAFVLLLWRPRTVPARVRHARARARLAAPAAAGARRRARVLRVRLHLPERVLRLSGRLEPLPGPATPSGSSPRSSACAGRSRKEPPNTASSAARRATSTASRSRIRAWRPSPCRQAREGG